MLALALTLLAAGQAEPALIPEASRAALAPFALKRLDGKPLRSEVLHDKVAVIAFWASWCTPCRHELTTLDAQRKELAERGVEVLAVAADGPETLSVLRSLVSTRGWSFTVGVDADGRLASRLNPRGTMPHSLFIDRKGRIAYVHTGFGAGDEKTYERMLAQLLDEPR